MVDEVQRRIQHASLAVLGGLIERDEHVALVDFPLHQNAGDSLIYAGEMAYLRRLGVEVRYQASVGRYRAEDLRRLHSDGPILLHGGGNFGDRWPLFQAFRERVIADFPDRRIVQLPQSIEMSDATAARVGARYRAHPDLTVLLRDLRSLRTAHSLLPGVDLAYCPDLAFGYEPAAAHAPAVDVLELRRADSESAGGDALFRRDDAVSAVSADWGLRTDELVRWHVLKAPGAIARRAGRLPVPWYATLVGPSHERIARLQLAAAERLIARGRVIVTDRLHGAVLATLLGRPVVARDTVNQKVSSIVEEYLGWFPSVALARDADHATSLVRERLAHPA